MKASKTSRRLLALFLAFVMSLTCAPEALAAEKSATAATMQLSKTEGTVEVSNGSGKKVTLLKNMRLRSGYRIATEEASYAWTNLDSSKLAKLDAVSEMCIRKSGKKLELLLDAGNLFFNVTEPLDEDESLNIRTSTMIVGIRGTSGWVKVIDQWTSEVYILEGTVTVSVTDPVTGDVETATVRGGESATCVVYPKEHAGRKCEIIRQTFTAAATPGFVQVELPAGTPMREPDPESRLERDQEEVRKRLEEIKTKLEAQDHNVSTAPVWADPEADKPAASNGGGSSSRPSGGNGGADIPTPPQPSGLMMPQTDNALNALLGQNSSISVQANPALDAGGNTLIVDSGLAVPAGKTLTLQSGIAVDVLGGQTMQVDGTMTVSGNVTNSGHISVASPNTLRVQGSLTNRRSLSVSATGHVVVDGLFVQQGAVALTEGALVRARGFSMGVEIPDWKVSDEPDGAGYYVLVYSPEEPEIFTVTLDPGDGTEPIVLETDKDGKLPALPTPADREGYTFEGWFTADGKPVTADTVFTEDMEIHAQWTEKKPEPEPETFTVTLDPGDGTEPIVLETNADGELPALPTPADREGFTFEGWFTADGKPVTTDTVFTKDMEIHAQWTVKKPEPEPETFTVTLDPGDGTEPIVLDTNADGKLPALPTPADREGFTFEGWFTADGKPVTTDTVFTEDMEIHAQWTEKKPEPEPETFTVTLDPGDGTEPIVLETNADGKLPALPMPADREGFTFEGWFTSDGKLVTTDIVFTSDATIYARWIELKTYVVTFNANGGSVSPVSGETDTEGLLSALPKPVWEGYAFNGWFTAPDGGTLVTTDTVFTADTTLYAHWTKIPQVTVTLEPNGGALVIAGGENGHSAVINAGSVLDFWPEAKRDGYTFAGWFTAPDGGTEVTTDTVFMEDITIYAHWTKTEYAITFDANGGSVTTASAETADGKLSSLPTPTWDGHIFGGWYTTADGGVEITTETVFAANSTIYAHWTIGGTAGENVTWAYDEDNKTLTISGAGAMENYTYNTQPWKDYQANITSVSIEDSITYIGSSAFENCSSLTSITIPDGVTSIGDYAFCFCRGLTSITIPDGVTSIGKHAFSHCNGLTSITIPDGVTSIDGYTFFSCSGLTSITIPDSVAYIGEDAFSSCSGLTSITIPDGVTSIRGFTFNNCSSLTSITIPDGVTSIGNSAFKGCRGLTSITIPDGVTSISMSAFSYCRGLTSITIPDGVTYIGESAFSSCSGLTSITISDDVTYIDDYTFSYCSGLTSITIPDGVTSIGNSAFKGCSKLTSITIPVSVTSIGDYAFLSCSDLKNVYYSGTEEQWGAITIGTDNDPLTTATIHYNSTGPADGTQTASIVSSSSPAYTDIPAGAWYAEAADYCREHNLMNGASPTKFAPDAPLTRAMLVTVLHRLAGSPAAAAPAGFADVPAGKWYTEAVSWANSAGIVLGYPDGSFGTNDPVTHGQVALIFQRYSGNPNVETVGADTPKSPATRAEIAVTLMNYAKGQAQPDSNASAMDVMVSPSGIALDADGNLLVTDVYNKQIWRVRNRVSAAYAGGQTVLDIYGQPLGGYNDAGLANSYFKQPWAIAPFLDGWAVSDTENNVVRLIRSDAIHTLNGATGEKLTVTEIGVAFNHPTGLASDDEGNLYVSDTFSGSIRKITPKGGVSTVARNLSEPTGLCWKDGVLYAAETGKDRIVKIQDGKVSAVASGFDAPQGVAVGDDGSVYVSDTGNDAVRAVKDGKVTTVAARDMASTEAGLTSPVGLLVQDGRLYVCDTFAKKIFVYQIG